jgi:hypothetical protein
LVIRLIVVSVPAWLSCHICVRASAGASSPASTAAASPEDPLDVLVPGDEVHARVGSQSPDPAPDLGESPLGGVMLCQAQGIERCDIIGSHVLFHSRMMAL